MFLYSSIVSCIACPIHICTICIIQLYSKICITVITLSFRWGICEMWVHDGPLLDTRTSHVPIGMLKWVPQAALRFANVNSSCSKGTNALGCIGLKVCLLSGSDESFWTTISCGADPFLLLLLLMASFFVLFADIFASNSSQTACLLRGHVHISIDLDVNLH